VGKILQIRNVSAESHEFSIHGERHARTRFSSESELRAARMTRLADETSVSRLRDNWTKSQTTVSLITDSLVSVHRFQRLRPYRAHASPILLRLAAPTSHLLFEEVVKIIPTC